MACCSLSFFSPATANPPKSSPPNASSSSSTTLSSSSSHSLFSNFTPKIPPLLLINTTHKSIIIHHRQLPLTKLRSLQVASSSNRPEPLKVMISGAPASGKGTQCQLITKKYDLVHIAAGDLLRAEIAAGTEKGRQAKEYMERGQLVPDEIVVMMVKDRLLESDAQENGWLLDGYPRSISQATALKGFGFQPDLFILLEVSEEDLVERVVGRRLDPVTGKIYHLKYSPPENEEIAARLTQRFDDTEEKVKLRLQTHHQNVESVLSMYEDITIKVNGNATKEDVFADIDNVLSQLMEQKKATTGAMTA